MLEYISHMGAFLLSLFAAITLLFNSLVGVFRGPEIYSPCTPAIRYKIGTVDKQFQIQEKQFLTDIEKATGIWEKALGREVFVYDPIGSPVGPKEKKTKSGRVITINLVYDDRQRLNSQITSLEGKVKNENKKVASSLADYEVRVKVFNSRSAALSEKIKSLNIDDPEYRQKFDEAFKESEELNREADELNLLAANLNQSTDSYNMEVGKLNSTISRFNNALAEKPEEGIYMSEGDVIEIYITNSTNELVHTLAHEFGHSLGIDHIENKDSIMYSFTTQRVVASTDDVTAVQEACKERVRK